MSDRDSVLALVKAWRRRAETMRRYGGDRHAIALEACAVELEAALGHTVLTLTEAAATSGYSADHLGHLVREGKIPNAGRPGRCTEDRTERPPPEGPESRRRPGAGRGASSGQGLEYAGRAIPPRRGSLMVASTKRTRRSHSAGNWGRNRVRAFSDPRTGIIQIEVARGGSETDPVTGASRLGQSKGAGRSIRRRLLPGTAPGRGRYPRRPARRRGAR